jgi:hypothetical protein
MNSLLDVGSIHRFGMTFDGRQRQYLGPSRRSQHDSSYVAVLNLIQVKCPKLIRNDKRIEVRTTTTTGDIWFKNG